MRCPQCGTENVEGKFCPQCGAPLAAQGPAPSPVAPPPPAPGARPPIPPVAPSAQPGFQPGAPGMPPGYPPQAPGRPPMGGPAAPPPAGGSLGWVKWVVIGVVVVGGVLFGLKYLGSKDDGPAAPPQQQAPKSTQNTPANPPPANPPKTDAPAKGAAVKLIAQGSLGERASSYATVGSLLGSAEGTTATFYKFDAAGKATRLTRISDTNSGELRDVTVGDLANTGNPVMVITYEKKIYIAGQAGAPTAIDNVDDVTKVLIGDYDGDGKNETVFMQESADGTFGFHGYRYQGQEAKELYSKTGRTTPFPDVWQTQQKAGITDILFGYVREGASLYCVLYKWDGVGGPAEIGRYSIADNQDAPAQWLASAPTNLGPTVLVARSGNPATVEFLVLSKDAKAATSLGTMKAEGQGWPAVMVSQYTGGKDPQMLTIDESGNYFLYDVSPK